MLTSQEIDSKQLFLETLTQRLDRINADLESQLKSGGYRAYEQCGCALSCSGRHEAKYWFNSQDYGKCKAIQDIRPNLLESKSNIETQINDLLRTLTEAANTQLIEDLRPGQIPTYTNNQVSSTSTTPTKNNNLLLFGGLVLLAALV